MKKAIIIIQARMSSTRMPGKIVKPFFEQENILQIQLEVVKHTLPDMPIVVATTTNPADAEIEALCTNLGVDVFRGSEDDVLQRFIDCADHFQAENVVRICSDNPFLSGQYLKELATSGQANGADYFSYQNVNGTPAIKTHWGLFAEWVSVDALKKAAKLTAEPFYHEHVTNYIYGNPADFNVTLNNAPAEVVARDDLRFTIDTPEDFNMAARLYQIWDKKSLQSLIKVVDERPEIIDVMKQGIARFTK